MASFEGTIQEFHHYIGPRIRNQINTKTKKIRNSKNGICEHCSEKNELESAHIHGKERRTIIESVLSKYSSGELVKVELSSVENEIIEKHEPVEQTFKFLCKSCHTKYDEQFKNKKTERKATSKPSSSKFSKLHRIKLWSKKPNSINSKIVSAYLLLEAKGNGKVKISDLTKLCSDSASKYYVSTFKSNYSSMKTDAGNSHGYIFDEDDTCVVMPIEVKREVEKYWCK